MSLFDHPWKQPDLTTSTDEYLRVASLSIALYDYIITLPAEWRFYSSQRSLLQPSFSCCLFFLIRYVSALVMVLSNIGFFSRSFIAESCRRYYIVAPIFKVFQSMISQTILGLRTYNISRRSRVVGAVLLVLFLIVTVLQWFTNMYERMPISDSVSCVPGNAEEHLVAWLYYLFSMFYDFATLCISVYYLSQFTAKRSKSTRLARAIRMMLYDGLAYFVALTGVNIFNTILYRASDEALQSASASLGYAVTWIMSQKILIRLHNAAADHAQDTAPAVIVAHPLRSARDINDAVRSQFELNSIDHVSKAGHAEEQQQLSVEVRVERFMTVEYDPEAYGRESHGLRSIWGSASGHR
ncbi:hypothetical protein OE88DRAFT_1662981 [Heliocybe sulcata]|uniref:DUF6533 domain-containing protein n=1 Tax=Heliocybe sulcata TaxID=5364 RepID=A0A5C3N041_9AGAM|nr:hypothetical protein OE88DRAFT_1662981 [Heliocybe sulcata]